MGSAAAFFDLDRTLLRGASGPLFAEALIAAGVAPDRHLPGERLFYRFYEVLGETLFGMALARQAATVARGWMRAAVQEAAEEAAEELSEAVLPWARPLIAGHKREGRPVVLSTTTPFDLVTPLAERLGFDDVVATRYQEVDGRYAGGIDGDYVWFTGKRNAVRRWAEKHGVALEESWAYSDSVYDLPLLWSVRHPHAVNPDPRLRVAATLRRWPIVWLDVPPGVPKLAGFEPFDLLRLIAHPQLFPYARFDVAGTEHLPREGPVIVVANHRSYFDPVVMGLVILRAGRPARFASKKEVTDAPLIGPFVRSLGTIRVDRGAGTGDALRDAVAALEAGEVVAMMPEGTIPRGEALDGEVLKGRRGAARLAAATRAPVIPMGLWGTERVWPRSARLPKVLGVLDPPHVRVRVGPPVGLAYRSADADTRRIMEAIAGLLPPEPRDT